MRPRLFPAPLAGEELPWTEIPAVRLLGVVLGVLLLLAAIRAMFGGRGGSGRGGKGRR